MESTLRDNERKPLRYFLFDGYYDTACWMCDVEGVPNKKTAAAFSQVDDQSTNLHDDDKLKTTCAFHVSPR